MNNAIDKAIEEMAKKVNADVKADDALKFSQSALNLAHVKAVHASIARDERAIAHMEKQ